MDLSVIHGQKISMNGSLLGFEYLNEFTIFPFEENPMFALLQSDEDDFIGFIVATPFSLFETYQFEISDIDKERINLENSEDALVLGILTIGEKFEESTMNLVAPIVVNIKNMKGIQLVLPPTYEYITKAPIS
ncbi:Flagellar assembly factor FliW [compost metagenome]|uniref:flagellar assembly protein FliW n=1 Tax=Paenibacillus sp. J53TS2 TaxID=2807197 RepID=UPI000FB38CF3|nr:flagellar assembly protein FliW [Paenibacillus sp. J53TS2]GIP47431.1 flagellar assembly factor FliW [Paenibacillus sp. J53TS2]